MLFIRCVFAAVLLTSLTACLTVTGPATDPFDEEHEGSIELVGIFNAQKAKAAAADSPDSGSDAAIDAEAEVNSSAKPLNAQQAVAPSTSPSDIDQQEFADFLKFKRERGSDSDEYQEFLEYQEYKRWLEFQNANKPAS